MDKEEKTLNVQNACYECVALLKEYKKGVRKICAKYGVKTDRIQKIINGY